MWRRPVFAVLLALFCEAARAEDLGVRGEVFPVAEPDLFSEIQARFNRLEAAGEVDRINQRLRDRAIATAERPPRVEGIDRTTDPRSFHFDPTVVVQENIVTPDGRIIASAGDTFNPLDYTPMQQRLVFFDGDDLEQVEWARAEIAGTDAQVQPILIGGPVLELTRNWRRQVFFDQGGKITERFGISQVPARVIRDGNRLLVEEVQP
ncbi:MAG: type-F conjugative transfer system protein TraW [Pseudomonadota bacterium]